MGLFDGRDALTDAGSTAEMSKLLALPVLFVVDASAMARSAAAIVHGFESFDQKLDVAGLIFKPLANPLPLPFFPGSVGAALYPPGVRGVSPGGGVTVPFTQ